MGFAQRVVQHIVKIILSFALIAAITVARRGLTIEGIGFRLIYSLAGIRGTADDQRDDQYYLYHHARRTDDDAGDGQALALAALFLNLVEAHDAQDQPEE